jgi:hypothetical protein
MFQGRMLANVTVCERVEGSRTCGGSPFWRREYVYVLAHGFL